MTKIKASGIIPEFPSDKKIVGNNGKIIYRDYCGDSANIP